MNVEKRETGGKDLKSLCAVSTSWRADIVTEAEELVSAIKETGISALELEFRISQKTFANIKKNRQKWGIRIVSLHAVCPSLPKRGKSAERFLICDADEDNRAKGIKDVLQTLRNAADVGARAVVVHCGRVPIEDPFFKIINLYGQGKLGTAETQVIMHDMMTQRSVKAEKCLPGLLKSMDELNTEAEKLGVSIGIENRYYYAEFPNMDELEIILSRFDGGKIGYWHDTGHAHVMETLYGVQQKKLLEKFGKHLIGIHLHDVQNGYTDHNEPGSGEIDFDMIRPFLKEDTIRVMELNKRVSVEGAVSGVEFLREKGIFPPE